MRRDVALAARVVVVAPGAADVVGALEHDEVVDALLLEADRHAQAGEPAADDGHVDMARRSVRYGSSRVGVAAVACRSGVSVAGISFVSLWSALNVDFSSIEMEADY